MYLFETFHVQMMVLQEFFSCSSKCAKIALISSVPVVYLFNVRLQFMLVSSFEIALAADKFSYIAMLILDMHIKVESVMHFIVTMFTGESPNFVMNSIHMSLQV